MALLKVVATAALVTVAATARAAGQLPGLARYRAVLPENPHAKQVASLEIGVAPASDRPGCNWNRLTATKVNGDSFTIWLLTDADPFTSTAPEEIAYHRYILQEPGRSPIEYIDRRTGRALPPLFGFAEQLLPRANGTSQQTLFEKGTYLGHLLVRAKTLEPTDVRPPKSVTRLTFRSDLIIGTGRNFRDDGKGRKSRKDNYNYVPFTERNYEEMIAAGINYFTAKGEQINWVCHRPVFYDGYSPGIAFPEELYRPNFLGLRMFIDEPACRLAGEYPPGAPLSKAVEMIHEHIREKMNNKQYRNLLVENGINLGSLNLTEPALPIWETYIGTSYYQLEANPVGIVQECRWRIDPNADSRQILMLQRINEEFDVDIPITPKNLFLWFYSQMRGPARAFNSKWGMSIYGQAEPHLRLPSMKLAYDLGAEFIWFWTSDHDHHVTYDEQLSLARQITEYAKAHPRPDLDKLRRAATTAIVLPYGYTLPTCWQLHTWGTHIYPLSRKNRFGLTYKQVLTPAIEEIARCLKDDISYDVVPAGNYFDRAGYDRVVRIREDGAISIAVTISNPGS
ncbi:MAG: hypothetical protein JSU70_14010 [Phycisphaerales bacterium]|nr:MAG: hypothetical protein JSU70_14010 [Phycisphaerales bacterium]